MELHQVAVSVVAMTTGLYGSGVLLVLLTPCVDYVIVFSSLAGGSS